MNPAQPPQKNPADKQPIRIKIPPLFRTSFVWTAFFAIIGVAIQSIQAGQFVFADFFSSNYVEWFRGFGNFVQITSYSGTWDFISSVMSHWYYFFYTGGLISLIWSILNWIVYSEI